MAKSDRLDQVLLARGEVDSLEAGRRLVRAGKVLVNGRVAVTPDERVPAEAAVELIKPAAFVGRGGAKLAAALDHFGLDVNEEVCADVGASTGGFTDCLLQRGATRVYAIDSGRGQLHWKLRQDPRVVVMESTNARHLERLPAPIATVAVDVSFISLEPLLPRIAGWLAAGGRIVALVKPQFEAEPRQVDPGGVVTDPTVRREVVGRALAWMKSVELAPQAAVESALRGPKGNREVFVWAVLGGAGPTTDEILESVAW